MPEEWTAQTEGETVLEIYDADGIPQFSHRATGRGAVAECKRALRETGETFAGMPVVLSRVLESGIVKTEVVKTTTNIG